MSDDMKLCDVVFTDLPYRIHAGPAVTRVLIGFAGDDPDYQPSVLLTREAAEKLARELAFLFSPIGEAGTEQACYQIAVDGVSSHD